MDEQTQTVLTLFDPADMVGARGAFVLVGSLLYQEIEQ